MKSKILMLIPLLLVLGCSTPPEKAAIERELHDRPVSRVQDLYKSFCQDNLGPEHMIPNPEYAGSYLASELATYRQERENAPSGGPSPTYYYPVGDEGNFVRVDLAVVLDSLVSKDLLLDAFVRSANAERTVSKEQWTAKWKRLSRIIRKDFSGIPEAKADLARIDSLIAAGNLIMHHSPAFREAYRPHYRIIARDIFESELKPLIDR